MPTPDDVTIPGWAVERLLQLVDQASDESATDDQRRMAAFQVVGALEHHLRGEQSKQS